MILNLSTLTKVLKLFTIGVRLGILRIALVMRAMIRYALIIRNTTTYYYEKKTFTVPENYVLRSI